MKKRFVNFSNHKVSTWGEQQLASSMELIGNGELIDFPFPQVNPHDTEKNLKDLSESCVKQIIQLEPMVVMCQGEFGLSYLVINQLKEAGVKVVYACSERITREVCDKDGISKKIAIFEFVQYREY